LSDILDETVPLQQSFLGGANSETYRAPRFSNLSFNVMAFATVTPSEEKK
jgi:hypothetical protein